MHKFYDNVLLIQRQWRKYLLMSKNRFQSLVAQTWVEYGTLLLVYKVMSHAHNSEKKKIGKYMVALLKDTERIYFDDELENKFGIPTSQLLNALKLYQKKIQTEYLMDFIIYQYSKYRLKVIALK